MLKQASHLTLTLTQTYTAFWITPPISYFCNILQIDFVMVYLFTYLFIPYLLLSAVMNNSMLDFVGTSDWFRIKIALWFNLRRYN